jgi:hypothetical protein
MSKTPKPRFPKNARLVTSCEKHGTQMALPLINGAFRPFEEWPPDVEKCPRVCAMCIAEAMVSPVRRAA